MNKWENAAMKLKEVLSTNAEKANDLDIIVEEMLKLPHDQLKDVLSEPVLAVLKKYGYAG